MVIWKNGIFISQNKKSERYSAMITEGKNIVEMGGDDLIARYPQAEIIDLNGKTVVPGFIDGHVHLLNYAYSLTKIDCNQVESIAEMIEVSRAYILQRHIPVGTWVQGRGWNQAFFTEQRNPTIKDLDAISTEHPIVFTRVCEHMVVVNTMAMELAGITKDTPNPASGEIERDENGNLTGLLKETARYLIYAMVPQKSVTEIKEMLQKAISIASSYGLTTVHSDDFETFSDKDWRKVLQAYREMEAEGKLNIRICEQCLLPDLERLKTFIHEEVENRKDTDMVKIGPLKLLTDGSLGGRTAFLDSQYWDEPGHFGIPVFTQENLNQLVYTAHHVKMGVVCHGIGDGAIRMIFDAFKYAQEKKADADARFGIIHLQITTPQLLERFRNQNVIAYMEPVCINSDLHIAESRVGVNKASTSYAYRTLCDMGVMYNISSDCPVDSLNPFDSMFVGVNHTDYHGYPKGGWMPEEKMTVEQMLKGFTANGAYASFEEDKKGSLEAGKLADFVILSHDPTAVNSEDLRDVKVLETFLGGKSVYHRF